LADAPTLGRPPWRRPDGDGLLFHGKSLTFGLTGSDFSTPTRRSVTYAGFEALFVDTGVFELTGVITPSVVVENGGTLGGAAPASEALHPDYTEFAASAARMLDDELCTASGSRTGTRARSRWM
jgi:hypothetical protein